MVIGRQKSRLWEDIADRQRVIRVVRKEWFVKCQRLFARIKNGELIVVKIIESKARCAVSMSLNQQFRTITGDGHLRNALEIR